MHEPLANARRVVEELPNAELQVYPGMDHLGPMMHPVDLVAACESA